MAEAAQIFTPSFWLNNQLLTLRIWFTTWMTNWQCSDSFTLIKNSLKCWRRKCPGLLDTPRPIMTWLWSHQRGSIILEYRRWSSGITSPKIMFWTGKGMRVSIHNAFWSGENRGKINILTMQWPFTSLFFHSYRAIPWRECFSKSKKTHKVMGDIFKEDM